MKANKGTYVKLRCEKVSWSGTTTAYGGFERLHVQLRFYGNEFSLIVV